MRPSIVGSGVSGLPPAVSTATPNRSPNDTGKAVWGPNGTRVKTSQSYWNQPLKWNKQSALDGVRRRVFCCSLADVFEDWRGPMMISRNKAVEQLGKHKTVNEFGRTSDGMFLVGHPPDNAPAIPYTMADCRRDLFSLIDATPHLDWLLLTKRPENVRRMWPMVTPPILPDIDPGEWWRPNVWIGTSVSDQKTADEYIPHLLALRDLSPVLFLSAEPLLGPVNLRQTHRLTERNEEPLPRPINMIDWVIVGGESGHGARPCHIEHVASLVEQCRACGVSCFVKQFGANVVSQSPYHDFVGYRDYENLEYSWRYMLKDPKGGDMSEWGKGFGVRQWPVVPSQAA